MKYLDCCKTEMLYMPTVRCCVFYRDVLNGDEMVVVEEDGVITTKTYNGRPWVTSV